MFGLRNEVITELSLDNDVCDDYVPTGLVSSLDELKAFPKDNLQSRCPPSPIP
jgi:hypothetical protein